MLLKAMILAVQKTHLDEMHFLRCKNSQLKFENLKRHDDEMLIYKDCNIVKKQLNSVAETVDCKQLINNNNNKFIHFCDIN